VIVFSNSQQQLSHAERRAHTTHLSNAAVTERGHGHPAKVGGERVGHVREGLRPVLRLVSGVTAVDVHGGKHPSDCEHLTGHLQSWKRNGGKKRQENEEEKK
jgi:hypothetical protein